MRPRAPVNPDLSESWEVPGSYLTIELGGDPDPVDNDGEGEEGGAFAFLSVFPATGSIAGGDTVVLNVTGAVDGELGAAFFDGEEAIDWTFIDSTHISVVVPAGSAGLADVELLNGDGSSVTLADGYTYEAAPGIAFLGATYADGTSAARPLPGGANDFYLLLFPAMAGAAGFISAPDGWTAGGNYGEHGDIATFYYYTAGLPDGGFDFTAGLVPADERKSVLLAFRGVNLANPFNGTNARTQDYIEPGSTTFDTANVTTSVNGCMLVAAWLGAKHGLVTPQATLTDVPDASFASTTGISIAVGIEELGTAGNKGTRTATVGNVPVDFTGAMTAYTFNLRPANVPGGGGGGH